MSEDVTRRESMLMDMDESEGAAMWYDIAKACPFSIVIVDTLNRVWLMSDKENGVVQYDRRLDDRGWSGAKVVRPDISDEFGMKGMIVQLVEIDLKHGDPVLEKISFE